MHSFTPSIVKQRWLALLIGALALTVFLWGLSYKLSLYAPKSGGTLKIAAARMLSENERAGVRTKTVGFSTLLRAASCLPAALSLWFAGTLFACYRCTRQTSSWFAGWQQRSTHMRDSWPSAALNAFFFRPPPTLY